LCGDTQVAADLGDDVGGGAMIDVVVEVGSVQPLGQFGVQFFDLIVPRGALDGILDIADDTLALENALLLARHVFDVAVRRRRVRDFSGKCDGAPDGSGDTIEGDDEVWLGHGVLVGACIGDRILVDPARIRIAALRGGFGLGHGLAVDHSGEVGAHVDQIVQDATVIMRVLRLPVRRWLVWRLLTWSFRVVSGFRFDRDWLGQHEQNKNIIFGVCQVARATMGPSKIMPAAGWKVRRSARIWAWEAEGLVDADLGDVVVKQRIARPGGGKSFPRGRTLIACNLIALPAIWLHRALVLTFCFS
jgi:hypothetical protein